MKAGATKLNGIWRPCIIYNDDTVEVLMSTTVVTRRDAIRKAWDVIVRREKKDRKVIEQGTVAKATTVPDDSQ